MIALIHGAVGASCAMVFRRRREGVAAALISHFVVDSIRHDEPFDENHKMRLNLIVLDGLLLGLALVLVGRRQGPCPPNSSAPWPVPFPTPSIFFASQRRMMRRKSTARSRMPFGPPSR